jgi:hypothetical protein
MNNAVAASGVLRRKPAAASAMPVNVCAIGSIDDLNLVASPTRV